MLLWTKFNCTLRHICNRPSMLTTINPATDRSLSLQLQNSIFIAWRDFRQSLFEIIKQTNNRCAKNLTCINMFYSICLLVDQDQRDHQWCLSSYACKRTSKIDRHRLYSPITCVSNENKSPGSLLLSKIQGCRTQTQDNQKLLPPDASRLIDYLGYLTDDMR